MNRTYFDSRRGRKIPVVRKKLFERIIFRMAAIEIEARGGIDGRILLKKTASQPPLSGDSKLAG
jgi:hypothetical protein